MPRKNTQEENKLEQYFLAGGKFWYWICFTNYRSRLMIVLIKPILFAFFKSDAVKKLLCDLAEKLSKETDNTLDDQAVAALRIALKV